MPNELEIWKTVAAKLAYMCVRDEDAAAVLLAQCVEVERKQQANGRVN